MPRYGPLTVNVTQKNIDEGEPELSCSCALALAILELPNVVSTNVYPDSIKVNFRLHDGGVEEVTYEVNEETLQFINNFDGDTFETDMGVEYSTAKSVKPCTLVLE